MITELIVNFFLGVLFGIIRKWNKKILFIIIVILILFVIISYFYIGLEELDKVFDIIKFILGVFMTFIGIKIGEIAYEETFEK